MKNALILHGAGNNSQGNWFPWLKNKLEDKGYNKDWAFNNDSIILGHSSGATLILRILEKLKGIIINKAILVAGRVQVIKNSSTWKVA